MTDLMALLAVLGPAQDVARTLQVAVRDALAMADQSGLPQTVFYEPAASCWTSTQALSPRLRGAHSFVTLLPDRYFTGYWLF